jgi:hypothetical protein
MSRFATLFRRSTPFAKAGRSVWRARYEIHMAVVLDKEEIGALQIIGLRALNRDWVLPKDHANEAEIGEGPADEIVCHGSHDGASNAAAL